MSISKILIILGILLLTTGIFLNVISSKLSWFGNLPLDFKYDGRNTKVYAPFGSMIMVSLILSFIFNLFQKLFK
ncbi:MAG: hypothetical protein CMG01_00895 [Candidatus Marinimicrobia bacterium]|nr:hypothetical protein [Candidatus Neomarinimicrobiota bacterium]|tara:strand:+ start:557 stop:778 length:222 start_codon:yes stop_codon:yes gene_type:complete